MGAEVPPQTLHTVSSVKLPSRRKIDVQESTSVGGSAADGITTGGGSCYNIASVSDSGSVSGVSSNGRGAAMNADGSLASGSQSTSGGRVATDGASTSGVQATNTASNSGSGVPLNVIPSTSEYQDWATKGGKDFLRRMAETFEHLPQQEVHIT